MLHRVFGSVPWCLVGLICVSAQADGEVDFDRQVRPILAANCLTCHGADEATREADLRLDTSEGSRADLGGRVAVRPGDPDASALVERIESSDPDEMMPPPDSNLRLTESQKQILRKWIQQGGRYETHWAFLKPIAPSLSGSMHPIDELVQRRLTEHGLTVNEAADRHQLIRRLTLDLTGLPPTIKQTDAFLADRSDSAVETLVDRLLSSPAYGEHWARMWLDLARYADTKGYEKDNPREIWRYRDWVIDALNQDMPFDEFTTAQLAGDLLPDATMGQRLATAFHRNTLTNEEGGTDDEEFRVAAVKDRVDTTVQVWMGLTMGCAKCHSHKYDPISQSEYYRFYAYFNQRADNDREAPLMESPTAEQLAQLTSLQETIAQKRQRLADGVEGFEDAYRKWKSDRNRSQDWQPLALVDFHSEQGLKLTQSDDRVLVPSGKLADKDTWLLTMGGVDLRTLTSLRIETFPKRPNEGNRSDKNHVINELTVELVRGDDPPEVLKLSNPRADFSQQNWPVAHAIDGKPDTGWAVSPKADQPHVAVFDFDQPPSDTSGAKLRIKIGQNYGKQLVLARCRVAVSASDPKDLPPEVQTNSREAFRREFPATRRLLDEIDADEKSLAKVRTSIAKTPIMQELPANRTRETRIHVRGNFLDPGDVVQAAVPKQFDWLPEDAPANRVAVAQWLMHPDNPLTARVMANRIWARLFGLGIVETEEDFGTQGLRPSHPELLDWLALEFRAGGWSIKGLLKTIVMSSTYQQSSVVSVEKLDKDPRNVWLSRGPRFRMSAEMIRDQALAASGLLSEKRGGPSVMPPQPDGIWKSTYSDRKWINATGSDRYRRGLYTYWKRTSPYPAMTTFDAGSGEVCLVRRVRTNTPLQALITLNDPAYFEAAGALATLMKAEGIETGFRRVLTRRPTEREKERLQQLWRETREEYESDPAATLELARSAGLSEEKADAELAGWITVANVLFNLDETVTKP